MKLFLLLITTLSLYAQLSENVHSSASAYAESRTYEHSKQKEDGKVFGLGADIHYKNSEYKFTYEQGGANIKPQLPLPDLKFKKLFLRYAYNIDQKISFNINYISVLDDNIALTDGGNIYALGATYNLNKHNRLNLTQYISDYKDFDTYQTDLQYDHKIAFESIKVKFSLIGKYIHIHQSKPNGFTKYAKENYFTTGLKAHMHYKSFHFGVGAYFGKRVFAIMQEGFKVQHHAMEFDRTYAFAFGKSFSNVILRAQYIYQRATELPIKNKNVSIKNIRLIANYKF